MQIDELNVLVGRVGAAVWRELPARARHGFRQCAGRAMAAFPGVTLDAVARTLALAWVCVQEPHLVRGLLAGLPDLPAAEAEMAAEWIVWTWAPAVRPPRGARNP